MIRSQGRPNRQARVILVALLFVAHLAHGAPISLAEPPDIPPEFKVDFIRTMAFATVGIPIAPRGQGTTLAYSLLDQTLGTGGATEEFVPRDPEDVGAGRRVEPKPGRIVVPHLTPGTASTVLRGMGAVGIDERAPDSIRRRNEDGTISVVPVVGKGSAAASAVAEKSGPKTGTLVEGLAVWMSLRDDEPERPGDQGFLFNEGYHRIGRTEDGPKKTAVVATLSEHKITQLPRGSTILEPLVSANFTTTLGIPGVPKAGRSANAVIVYEGIASFAVGPLWSLILEYTPDGRLLSQFTSSNFLREIDDPLDTLDDAAILEAIRDDIGVDADGKLSVSGSFDFLDFDLFKGQVQSRGPWDYTQRVVTYSVLQFVPEPGILAVLGLGLAGLATMRRRER